MRTRILGFISILVAGFSVAALAQVSASVSVRTLMTDAEFRRAGLTKLSADELGELDRWLARFARAVADVSTPSTPSVPPSPPSPAPMANLSLADLEGAIVVASDGRALGLITTNCFRAEALCNQFGQYGNRFNANSILNQFGPYGNPFSATSPFNEFTSTPPQIFKNGKAIAYLTRNRALTPRIDPLWLLGALEIER